MEDLKKLGTDIRFMSIINTAEDHEIMSMHYGEEQGLIRGQQAKMQEMVKTMYKNGMSIKDISKYNSITLKEVKEIIANC